MNEHPEDLSERLLSLADRQPRAPALCAAGRAPMSFGSLGERIERVRSRLRDWGLSRGDVVAWPVVDRPVAAAAIAAMPGGCAPRRSCCPMPGRRSVRWPTRSTCRS
jgi:non-ribosomal peptide synthetase component E (peptide arylation enzyme)